MLTESVFWSKLFNNIYLKLFYFNIQLLKLFNLEFLNLEPKNLDLIELESELSGKDII